MFAFVCWQNFYNICSDIPYHNSLHIFTHTHSSTLHDDVIKWKHFPRYWPFVRGIHRHPVNSPHKGQWRGTLMFSLICVWINGWENNREAGDFRRYRAHYDVIVMAYNSPAHRCVSMCSTFNSSFPGQNGGGFADDIFRCILMNEKFCILFKI